MAEIQRIYLAIFMVFLASATAGAQGLPTAEELFAAHTKRLGFEHALASYGTIEAHAHVTVGDREYDTEVKASVSPAGFGGAEFTIIRGGMPTLYSDKDGALTRTTQGSVPEALPESMRAFIHGHQFHLRVLFPALTFASVSGPVSEAIFANAPVYKVAGKTRQGDDLAYYFDATSTVMLGFQLIITEETGPRPMDFIPGGWSTKGGETLFWRLEIADKGDLYIYEYNKILLLP